MLIPFALSLLGLLFLLVNAIRFCLTQKGKNVLYRIITVYLVLLFLEELACNIIGFLHPGSNFFLSHYYFIFQFIILSLFFKKIFASAFLKRMVILILVVVVSALIVQYSNEPNIYWQFNLFEVGITSIPLIVYSLIFLVQNFKKEKHQYFYFCNGLIVYLSSSASIFLTGNSDSVIFTEPFILDFWFFNSLFYILYQFLVYKEWKALNCKTTEIFENQLEEYESKYF